MNRRQFLGTTAATTALLSGIGVGRGQQREEGPMDEEILAAGKERIRQHRQGDGVVVIRGADGKPVAGAGVKLEQVRHEFLFGCNFFMFGRFRDSAEEEAYRRLYAGLLNYATLGFYWAPYERVRGEPNYVYTDEVLDWCRANGIVCKGHPLAWDHPAGSPKWLPEDLGEVDRLSLGRVRDCVSRFKGRLDVWDVVNEPTHLGQANQATRMSQYAVSLGAVPYVRKHLRTAREANRAATLLVNDYRLEPRYYEILEGLRDGEKPLFDVVGLQSHMHGGVWPLQRVQRHCDAFARLGVPLHFTETTVVSGPRRGPGENWGESTPELEETQAQYVESLYRTLFAHPAVEAVTWWDFADKGAWQGAAAGFLRKDLSRKPVYDRLQTLIKAEWWTNSGGTTGADGQFKARAYFGTHRATISLPGGRVVTRDLPWRRGKVNRFEIVV